MQPDPHQQYLASKVMTATPQKLHLMLIEGAIRYAQQAKANWDDEGKAGDALTRCLDIAGELLACVRNSNQPVAKQLASVYAFIFRTITEAMVHHDAAKLDDALMLLAIERETWRQVCEKFGGEKSRDPTASGGRKPAVTPAVTPTETPTQATPPAPPSQHAPNPLGSIPPLPDSHEGLSLEA